jgi:hypothetical protein|tara:strand:- start:1619 stop:2215 length:597 start_codon:yes stop_codon:yes gene_type:complete
LFLGDTSKGLIIMSTVTTATAFVPTAALVEARQGALSAAQGLGGAERSAYGANRTYAAALNDAFGFAWFTFRDAGELKKASPEFAGEKDTFYKAYRAVREVSNMSKIWGDIKGYGEADAKNRELFGWVADVETDGETETESGGAGSAKRSPDMYITEEMTAAFKRLSRDDEQLSAKGKIFRGSLLAALKAYGITGLEG